MIYLELGRGVAIGIVIDGKLYYGKNGFAGEFGHIPFFDNETICACGKKGCLETEVSGIAIEEKIVNDLGKVETPGGRRPNVFGLANSAIYFAGVNVGRDNMTYVITDLQNNIIKEVTDSSFELQNRPQCLEKICSNIENFINDCGIDRAKILGLGV